MQLEGFVQAGQAEARFAGRVAIVSQRTRAALSEQITAARLTAADRADSYRALYAIVLDKRQRGRAILRTLQARLDAALIAMDEANDRVSEALRAKAAA